MLLDKSVSEFLSETASSSPAPGGGSASAFAAALGTALTQMVITLTVGKKKYAEVSAELAALLPPLEKVRIELQALVDKDTEAFNAVMTTFGLPKETEIQIQARSSAIQAATVVATEVPLEVMHSALAALEMTLIVAKKGNRNSASDAGVAGLLLVAGLESAALNVKINLPGLPDDLPFKKNTLNELEIILAKKNELAGQIREAVGL
jgi:formiminotetrahydrofolate cyclodeaminase